LNSGADTSKNVEGGSYLHWAAKNGHLHIVDFLVKKGSRINALDYWEHTPLYVAKNNEIKEYLIKNGGKVFEE